MAFFEKKECCICGGKAGMLSRQKLVDKSYICGDCVAKCSPNLHSDNFAQMNRQKVLDSMQYTIDNDELFNTRFQETEAVKTGLFGGSKVISVDSTNGWWVIANQNKPDVFGFDQVSGWQLKLDTVMKSEEEMKENKRTIMPPRNDMPMCRSNEKINRMYLRVTLRHPYVTYVDLNVMNAMFVTDGDIEAGYRAALDLITMFERFRYQQSYAQQNNYGYAGAQANAGSANRGVSAADELKKYKELLDMGAITEQEYEAKKRQLLGL